MNLKDALSEFTISITNTDTDYILKRKNWTESEAIMGLQNHYRIHDGVQKQVIFKIDNSFTIALDEGDLEAEDWEIVRRSIKNEN